MSFIRFIPSTPNYEALVRLPAMMFREYIPDAQRMYERGEVIRVDSCKYLLQGDGRIDIDKPPSANPLCKLFRDGGRYEWVREEYCSRGFERYYDDGDPQRTGWYRVTADNAGDNNTPPPGIPQTWKKLDG